ncbi:MAG: cyclic nucleotide-binding domain-containing protein, partial [Chloroflexota bacterium]
GLLRRCLHAADAETRAQAIEALDAIGDARLGRSLVRLLDSDGTAAGGVDANVDAIARSLADDPDPWVRALALRTLTDEADGTRRWAAAKASADRDAVVRLAVGPGGIDAGEGGGQRVPESRQTLGEIDRMLILRRVSLFEALAPEDLQRIATAASERTYAGGEALVREGELGDELVVIVEGTVRVIHTEPQGEHVVRSYGPGDHIGELAVLREGLRSATVEADEPGVRGLVIGGEALAAILRERPDAAMAMLSTLADRLATTRNG